MSTDRGPNEHYQIEAHGNLDCAHWSDGPFCPHCGEREAIRVGHEQTSRPGIYHCLRCRKRFAGVLDILFQADIDPRNGTSPFDWIWARNYAGPKHGFPGFVAYGLWYAAHVLRQIIIGSDPTRRK